MNPANVPRTMEPYWIIGSQEPCTFRQQYALKEELGWEGVDPAEFFGDGFSSFSELSKWAAHWALEYLNSARIARGIEQQRRQAVEANEQELKAWIGGYYRRKAMKGE